MPIDLDDMFTTLGRHADTIPLAPAARARRRGQQRTRTRAMIAAATAVCLIAAGTVAVRHDRQAPPATTKRGLAAVGAPIEFGGQARVTTTTGTDGRLYTAWQVLDGKIKLTAVELRTGAIAWPAREVGSRTDTIGLLHALPQALILAVSHRDSAGPDSTMNVYDPVDGRQRWNLPYETGDNLVVHRSALIRMSARTGQTEAFDWATGATRWALAAPADRPVHTVGNWLPMTGDVVFPSAATVGRADDNLIQVTEAGEVQVRDITTGELRRTVTSVPPDKDPRTFFGYDGRLYNDEHACCEEFAGYRVRVTDLRTDRGGSTVLLSEGAGHQLDAMLPCGPQRLCVLDQDRAGRTTLAAIDLTSHRQLWRIAAPAGALSFSTSDGYILVGGPEGDKVVYDQDGKQVFSTTAAAVDWLDKDTLLLLPGFLAGPARKVTIPGGRVTTLGDVPASSDACTWTSERLACPTITSLRIWRFTG
ncbi:hypothetical protein DMB66_15690 [Actinoplanes sp. ATCC 53533]|uniref:hypothetical protein n=1 Tax=Actinoplanes sp. ATCC 53533 TaxID=1288362 RepID=UPI000F79BD8A|nr:hypothetical protein [Actinoplanes sp. ATCC 53533]RSM67462.1 hypothetical protein DMB66_15690 [Actinoplanes sp. ATCC 53533]